jgi:hypothetical protein
LLAAELVKSAAVAFAVAGVRNRRSGNLFESLLA